MYVLEGKANVGLFHLIWNTVAVCWDVGYLWWGGRKFSLVLGLKSRLPVTSGDDENEGHIRGVRQDGWRVSPDGVEGG